MNKIEVIKVLLAVAAFAIGAALIVMGLWLPPIGTIDNSVLVAVGEFLTFSASVLGINYTLCYISILHQTTTSPTPTAFDATLCYISILHQTTTSRLFTRSVPKMKFCFAPPITAPVPSRPSTPITRMLVAGKRYSLLAPSPAV